MAIEVLSSSSPGLFPNLVLVAPKENILIDIVIYHEGGPVFKITHLFKKSVDTLQINSCQKTCLCTKMS